jgi:hypothetical protein
VWRYTLRSNAQLAGKSAGPKPGMTRNDADRLERFLDRVMEALLELDAEDATVSGALARGSFAVSITIAAETPEQAIEAGSAVVRGAMNAAGRGGGELPEWIAARAARVAEGAEANV